MAPSESGRNLAELINKAIEDLELTTAEYEEILSIADADGVIDSHEKELLKQLQDMIANGTIKRIPG